MLCHLPVVPTYIVAVGDCVWPQMSVAEEDCWLQNRYQAVLPTITTHIQHIHTNKLCLPLIALIRLPNKRHFVLQVSYVCWHLSEHRLQDIDPEGLSDILQPNCALFCNFHHTQWFSLDISSPSSKTQQLYCNFVFWYCPVSRSNRPRYSGIISLLVCIMIISNASCVLSCQPCCQLDWLVT